MMQKLRLLIRKRRAFIKALLILVFLVMMTVLFTYPSQIWFIAVIGGSISAIGVFFKGKILITSGILAIGATFYAANLNLHISLSNMILLTGFFILFYGCGIYVYEFSRLDIILNGSEDAADERLKQYMKKWKVSAFKYLSLAFLIATIASVVSMVATIDQSVYQGQTIHFTTSILFALLSLVITFILIVKLPGFYENRDR